MGANFWKNARGIVIVGNADRTNIDGCQCVRERQFQHHDPLWRFIKRKGAMFVMNRGGKSMAGEQQQSGE
ncbi:hypothetical protein KATP_21710 [Kluyvera ascorbata]|nr:hypothetical protein KATP_21710 [Kluyvera ascorbata]